jgi:polyisoprenoid-binding protein YceI
MKYLISLLALTLLVSTRAEAQPYTRIIPATSSVTFRYSQMGVAMDGRFRNFSPEVRLDPAKPQDTQARVLIDLASVDTGSSEADAEVIGKSWFNVAAHPTALFVLESLKQTGPGQFEAAGKLTLKGRSREIKAPLKLSPRGVLTGGFIIRRADYAIGEGMWSKFDVVANDVTVNLSFTLKEST